MSCKHVRIEKLKKLSRRLLCRIYAHQQQTTLALIRIILIVHSSSTALQLLRSEPTTRSSNMADLKKIMEMAAILSKKVRYVDGHGEERLLYCVSMRVDGTFQLSKSNLTSICHSKMFAGTRTHTRRLPMYIMWCLCAYVTICWHQHVILGSTLRCIVSYDRLMDHEQVSGKTRRLFAHMLTCSPLLN